MNRWSRVFAIACGILYFAAAISAALIAPGSGTGLGLMWTLVPMSTLAVFGPLIVLRQPGNRVGWVFALSAVLWGGGTLADTYALDAYAVSKDPSFLSVFAAWFAEWYWIPFLTALFVLAPLLFPTGELPSKRWKPFAAVVVTALVAIVAAAVVDERLDIARSPVTIDNPIGLPIGADVDDGGWTAVLMMALIVLGGSGAVTSLVLRLRRAHGIERQQLKWFLYGAGLFFGGFVLAGVSDAIGIGRPPPMGEALLFSLLPAGAATAILRYRLYDIDLIINRTLVYGVLTGVIAASYVVLVVAFQSVLSPLTQESDVAIAASTLAVAALFGPLRRRIQAFIDRRFYRSRYDAQRTLESFSTRLRDQVDLDHLRSDLLDAVATTVGPRHASLWLRTEQESAR